MTDTPILDEWSTLSVALERRFVGESHATKRIRREIQKLAGVSLSAIISGEPGVGKVRVAQIIHELSARGSGRFLQINLLGVPPDAGIPELFGQVSAGRIASIRGLIEEARGGTLLLNNVDAAPRDVQCRLAEFLDTSIVRRIGGSAESVDVRVLAASTIAIYELQASPQMSPDLIHRLAIVGIEIPPLRERREDIPVIAKNFLRKFGYARSLHPAALDSLMSYHFPGNVRELKNIIQRAVLFSDDADLKTEALGLPSGALRTPEPSPALLRAELTAAQGELTRLQTTSLPATPIWQGRAFPIESDYCFALMPFGQVQSVQEIYRNHVVKVVNRCNLRCERADDLNAVNGVMQLIWESICRAKIIIADLTGKNPNVFYELGVAHTLGKPVIMITESIEHVPSDLRHLRAIEYSYRPDKIQAFEEALERTIRGLLSRT
jgi:Sigma-54 interaction domain